MQASVKKFIGETEYEITKPLAQQGLEFSLAVGKYAVPFAAQLVVALESGNMSQIIATASQLLVTLTPADVKYINDTLGSMTQAHLPDGKVIILRDAAFQNHFADRYDEWLTWVVFGIQTVCGSFFNGVLGLGALLKKKSLSAGHGKEKTAADTNSQSQSSAERTG